MHGGVSVTPAPVADSADADAATASTAGSVVLAAIVLKVGLGV